MAAERNEVREFLTDRGLIKVVELTSSAIDGIMPDSIYLNLMVEMPGGKVGFVWIAKSALDFAVGDGACDTLCVTKRPLPFVVSVVEWSTELFKRQNPVALAGIHCAEHATVVPTYGSREAAVAAA